MCSSDLAEITTLQKGLIKYKSKLEIQDKAAMDDLATCMNFGDDESSEKPFRPDDDIPF